MFTGVAAAKHFCATDCATRHPAQSTLGEILHSGADFSKPLGPKNPFFPAYLVDLTNLVDLVDLVDRAFAAQRHKTGLERHFQATHSHRNGN